MLPVRHLLETAWTCRKLDYSYVMQSSVMKPIELEGEVSCFKEAFDLSILL